MRRFPGAVGPPSYANSLLAIVAMWFISAPIGVVLWLVTLPAALLRRPGSQPRHATLSELVFEPETKRSGTTIVCLHGWPDSMHMWTEFAQRQIRRGHRVVSLGLPGFCGEPVTEGYGFDALATALRTTLAKERESGRVVLAVHDWGAVIGLHAVTQEPTSCERTLVLDVGRARPKVGPGELMTVAYQSYLAFAQLLGGVAGTFMARILLRMLGYRGRPVTEVTGDMGYPYRHMLRRIRTGTAGPFVAPLTEHPPMQFVYATQKPAMFHDREMLAHLRATPHCEVHELECTHWILSEKLDELCAVFDPWEAAGRTRTVVAAGSERDPD